MKPLLLVTILCFLQTASLAETPVVFPDEEIFSKTGRDFLIESTIPGNFSSPEGLVAAMFLLGDQVKNKKLEAPFGPSMLRSTSHYEGAKPLGTYFRGARVEGTSFIISFSGGAMRYLNNTAAIQEYVKGAIEYTIKKNFPKVEKIEYEIDGKIVEGWDA